MAQPLEKPQFDEEPDDMSPEEEAELEAALRKSEEDIARGDVVPAEQVLQKLRHTVQDWVAGK